MLERLLQKKVSVRLALLAVVIVALGGLAFGNIVRVAANGAKTYGLLGELALELASIPKNFKEGMRLVLEGEKKDLASAGTRFGTDKGFTFFTETGAGYDGEYLLLSRYDADRSRSVVELVDMAQNQIIHRWIPDFEAIVARSKLESNLVLLTRDRTPARSRIMHPLLLADGDIVFQDTAPLVRSGPCGEIRWMIDGVFHHSNEMHSASGFWVESFLEPQTIERVGKSFKEDAIVHVSPDGEILFQKSVAELLIENGMGHHVYGQDFYSDDPLHMNDVQEATIDSEYWEKGDLFLSLRNNSAIVQYRPSTNKVIWIKQGPWVNQHDVDILDDHRIVIFVNSRYNFADRSDVHDVNQVMIYDFATDTVTSPYYEGLKAHDVRTISEGRSEIYPNGDVFVEESNYGRLLRLNKDGDIVWQYINRAENGDTYRMNWSRVVPKELAEQAIKSLSGISCAR